MAGWTDIAVDSARHRLRSARGEEDFRVAWLHEY